MGDPINLLFRGKADPVRIRAALLALDGDRTAFGLPDAWPFNATWADCIGGTVQTGYAQRPDGWIGGVVQLMLGDYEPVRFHLRLFPTGVSDGTDGEWTLGAAHFEVRIPGTADHQVLSWEVAERIVVAELIALTGGPQPPVAADVPLVSDGGGMVLDLAGEEPLVPGTWTRVVNLEYGQVVPKPFYSTGPWDYLHVTGPITFNLTVTLDRRGEYSYRSNYDGNLVATPVDVTSGQPVPAGAPYNARVTGNSAGSHRKFWARVWTSDKKLTNPGGGPELFYEWLRVPDRGEKKYSALTRCVDDDPTP